MYTKQDLINLLEMTEKIIPREYGELPPDALLMKKDSWTAIEHIRHACNSERGLLWVLKNVVEGGEGASKDFDLEHYNTSSQEKLSNIGVEDAIIEFRTQRANTKVFVDSIAEEQLDLKGRHASHRIFSVREFIFTIAVHPLHHLKAICDIVGKEFVYDDLVGELVVLFSREID